MLSTSELPSVAAFCFGRVLTSLVFFGAIGFSSDFCLVCTGFDSALVGSGVVGSGVFRALGGRTVFSTGTAFLGVGGSGVVDWDLILSCVFGGRFKGNALHYKAFNNLRDFLCLYLTKYIPLLVFPG